ncbi:MAG TPA: hypothetical protein VHZ95_10030, partial [Polyangiales bacterium]|nr:hypothetical protein [Polyangiales bacterium]
MSKSAVEITRASSVCAVVCLVWGWSGCSPSDPIPSHPLQTAGFTGSTGVGVPAAGSGVAGYGPIAGTFGGVAGYSAAGQSGTVVPQAGGAAVAANGGSGGQMVVGLQPFDAGNDPSRNAAAPGGLCARLAAIDCAGEAHCCNAPGRTVDACRADVMQTCSSSLYLDQLAMNPVTGFDQTATTSAFTELEQKASVCDVTVAAWGGSTDGLRGILKGTLAANANCKPTGMVTDPVVAGAALASCSGITTTACLP